MRSNAGSAVNLISASISSLMAPDNSSTRYLVSDACYFASTAGDRRGRRVRRHADDHSRARAGRRGGQKIRVSLSVSGTAAAGSIPACAEAGILGALTGVMGSLMALEIIREIVGFGEGLVGRLLMLDARAMRFETSPILGSK